ncbi:hypothetical protein Btru_063334 [Bulinus truncatus]|nr:hypothetical protein Btru_063334 [Bulinus truncatus]
MSSHSDFSSTGHLVLSTASGGQAANSGHFYPSPLTPTPPIRFPPSHPLDFYLATGGMVTRPGRPSFSFAPPILRWGRRAEKVHAILHGIALNPDLYFHLDGSSKDDAKTCSCIWNFPPPTFYVKGVKRTTDKIFDFLNSKMVKILANGDIVSDDDPRVKHRKPPERPQHGFHSAGNDQDNQRQVQQVSIFQTLNQRLLSYGIPRWSMGNIVIEPLVLIGLIISLLIFGLPGLLFGLLLFAVCSWSQNGAPDFISNFFGGMEPDRDNNRNRGRAGGGYRLGR